MFCRGGAASVLAPAPLFWRRNNCACARLGVHTAVTTLGRGGDCPGPQTHLWSLRGDKSLMCQRPDPFPSLPRRLRVPNPIFGLRKRRNTRTLHACVSTIGGSGETTDISGRKITGSKGGDGSLSPYFLLALLFCSLFCVSLT